MKTEQIIMNILKILSRKQKKKMSNLKSYAIIKSKHQNEQISDAILTYIYMNEKERKKRNEYYTIKTFVAFNSLYDS